MLASATCAAEITEWSGRASRTWESLDGVNITLFADGTFKFQSVTGGSVAAIGTILVDNSVTGTVTLHIERNPAEVGNVAGQPGATNVGSIDLINGNATPTTGNLAFINITGALGGSGVSQVSAVTGALILGNGGLFDGLAADLDASAAGVSANITIDGTLSSVAALRVGAMTGNLTIDALSGAVNATSLNGDITINGASLGNITIGSSYSGDILFADGTYTGDISISEAGDGIADLAAGGTIKLKGGADFFGLGSSITIEGDLDGEISAR
jgi:hypothetical protein